MSTVSVFLFFVSFVLAVVIGPQMKSWTWGPSLVVLALSLLAGIPAIAKRKDFRVQPGMLGIGIAIAVWFAWRASISPVQELAMADLMLLCAAAGSFIAVQNAANSKLNEGIFVWGIALLLLASIAMIAKQVSDPAFNPIFPSRTTGLPAGFYRHYNEGANFLVGMSLLLGGAALFGKQGRVSRILWGLIAIAGLAAVYWTRSRGGILAAGVGAGTFAGLALVLGKRSKAIWFGPAVIIGPLLLIGLGYFVYRGWADAQELRFSSDVETVVDNPIRLYLIGIAVSCIGSHPLAGGGSRSFSWECNQFWDSQMYGFANARPEQVHNELLQAATDYGVIGAGLLLGFIATILISAVIRSLFGKPSNGPVSLDAVQLGGFAAFCGMFVQSSFSFVFHLLPGAMLLGICLARTSRGETPVGFAKTRLSKTVAILASLAIAGFLLPAAAKSTLVLKTLWPTQFSDPDDAPDTLKIKALAEAARISPQAAFYKERAMMLQTIVVDGESKENYKPLIDEALTAYAEAAKLHPYDSLISINRANLLSIRQRDDEAEQEFRRSVKLQGGMESNFRSHFYFAHHLLRKAVRELRDGDSDKASSTAAQGAEEVEMIAETMGWFMKHGEAMELKIAVYETLGAAREAAGDFEKALECYEIAAAVSPGNSANYRAGVLVGKMAASAWSERRPSEALTRFMEARNLIASTNQLPSDVTPERKAKYLTYLDESIEYLKTARIEPLEPK